MKTDIYSDTTLLWEYETELDPLVQMVLDRPMDGVVKYFEKENNHGLVQVWAKGHTRDILKVAAAVRAVSALSLIGW